VKILVDSDSMPAKVREIVIRASHRLRVAASFFSATSVPILESHLVTHHVVSDADEAIVAACHPGDIVVTRDVPLAARLIDAGAVVLNDRGDTYDRNNIGERLSIRDAAKAIRDSGLEMPRGRTFGRREVQRFANALDRHLARSLGARGVDERNPD
jgi:hypothetical protein